MNEPTVLLNEDAMEDALLCVRGPQGKRKSNGVTATVRLPKPPDPPAHPQTAEWLACERERRDLEAKLKTLVTRQDRLRQQILERWSMDGTSQERVDGYTVHTQRHLYPKVANKARLAIALRGAGLTELLTVDDKAFGVYVTACDEEGHPLPDSIAAYVPDKFERFDLRVRMPGRAH